MTASVHPPTGDVEVLKVASATDPQPSGTSSSSPPSVARQAVTWLCIIAGPVLVGISFFPIIRAALLQEPWLITIFQHHYAAIFGLPAAALLAFILVVVFEARFDHIEMDIFNLLKFRGASGPIVLWVLCFLSITSAIKLLW